MVPRSVQPQRLEGRLADVVESSTKIDDMVLAPGARSVFDRLVREQNERAKLREQGYAPMRKLLLVGPPGTGKTMTGAALAGELGIPLCAVKMHGFFTSYLGETSSTLRLIFDAIRDVRGVYLFDEFDAIGSTRSSDRDVGEIRRVLNSFLQLVEEDESDSVVLCATNLQEMLDSALFRRFDELVCYDFPDEQSALRLIRGHLPNLDGDPELFRGDVQGLCHANIVRACIQVAKDALLDGTPIKGEALARALKDRRAHQV